MGLRRIYLVFAFLCIALITNAQQKEGNIWYFGRNAGIDFNASPPKALSNGAINTIEGCAVICNRYGNLMFYTDGSNVYNKNHALMTNGSNLKGNPSSTQSGIIVPNPSDPKTYYIFSASGQDDLYYSVIDTSLSGGLGEVTAKNIALMQTGTEKLNAVKHKNNVDTWVVSHQKNNNSFYAYIVTSTGVNTTPVISNVGSIFSNISAGWLKFSPKGDKIVTADFHGIVEIFDFNATTGVISNAQTLINANNYYGVEFSASGKFLYLTRAFSSQDEIIQFDMTAGSLSAIQSSKVVIKTSFNKWPGALQLAPDGKIYLAFYDNGTHLGVIHEPDKKGLVCDFVENGFALSPGFSSWGLPSFNQSFFYKPDIDIAFDDPKCNDLNVRIFNTGDTDKIIKSYWDFGDNTIDSGKVVNKTYQNHGIYDLVNIVYAKNEDTIFVDTLKKSLRTKILPVADFWTLDFSQCVNENFFEFIDSSEYLLGAKYKSNRWRLGKNSPNFYNTKSIARKYTDAGVYDIELIVESDDGCFDTTVKQITVRSSPKAKFEITDSVQCSVGNNFILQQQSAIDTPSQLSAYKWDFGDNNTSTQPQPTKKYTDTGSFIIRLEVIGNNACRDTIYDTVRVLPSPKADFNINDICYQDTAYFNNNSTTKTTALLQYLWKLENEKGIDTSTNPKYYYADSGQYAIKLIATNIYDCKDSTSKTIQVYPKPVANFTVLGNCTQHTIAFTNNTQHFGSNPPNYVWDLDDGKKSTSSNPNTSYNSYGEKTITLKVKNQYGCEDSISQLHNINPLPQADIAIDEEILCIKDNKFLIDDASSIAQGTINQYHWYIDGILESQNQNLASQNFTQTGSHNIKLIIQSDSGCLDSVNKAVLVYPNIELDIKVDKVAQCFNEHEFIITNNSTVNGVGTIEKYSWIYSDNTVESTENPPPKKFSKEGSYNMLAILETDQGCLDTFTQNLTVWYSPQPEFDTKEICFGDSAYFDNNTPNKDSIAIWRWDFGDGTTQIVENPYRKYPATGNYEISLIATTKNNCKDTIVNYYPNLVRPRPSAYFEDTLIDSYDKYTTIQFTNKSTGGTNYIWDFGDGTTETIENPEKIYSAIGQFPVSLTTSNSWDCEDIYVKNIFVVPTSYINIPTAFTPGNGDELNRYFRVEGIYYTKEIDMKIFSRWGTLIYHSNEIEPKWDGRYKGELVQDGVYLYTIRILDYNNKIHIYNGSITVLK